jgi:hypothetical protein
MELDTVLLRALDPDRSKRFRGADEFAKALKAASSAFMWKPAQRAEFVEKLFQTRKRREQVLLAGCEEIMWAPKRKPTAPKMALLEQAKLPEVVPAPVPSAPKPTASMRMAQAPAAHSKKKHKKAKAAKRRSHVRVLSLALVASALGFVWERGLVDALMFPAPPVASRAAIALGNAPLTLPSGAGSPAELIEEATEHALESARTLYGSRPKVKFAHRKHDDAPLPPWLASKKRH